MIEFIDWFFDMLIVAVRDHAYLIAFVFPIIENMFILGSFVPGDLLVAAAAFTAVTTPDGPSVLVVWLLAFAGTLIGANISYVIGVRGGRPMFEAIASRWGRIEETYEAAETFFERHGNKSVFFARYIAVFKNITPTLAGAGRMRFVVFEAWTVLGAATYVSLMVGIGALLGEYYEVGVRIVTAFSWFGLLLVVAVIAFLLWGKRRYTRRKLAELGAERELEMIAESLELDGEDDADAPQ